MKQFVDTIEAIVPVFPAEATANARAPYATYVLRETPIRTKEGIAGHEGTLTLSIYCATYEMADAIAERVIAAVDTRTLDGRTYYYADIDSGDYPDVGLVSKEILFNTLE